MLEAQIPFAIAEAFFATEPVAIFRAVRRGRGGVVAEQIPGLPLAVTITRATHREPGLVRGTLTIVHPAQGAVLIVAHELQLVELTPRSAPLHFRVAFDANDKTQAQLVEQGKEFAIRKTAIRRARANDAARRLA